MGTLLLSGFALMLVFEGLLPFASPPGWRAMLQRVLRLNDGQIRLMGLVSMLVGLGLLLVLRP
jgi:hypothetical protein